MRGPVVSPELVRRQAEELQDLSHDEARAAELASEVERLNRQVAESAAALQFDDEPLAYRARLVELAGADEGPPDPAGAKGK